MKSMRFWSVTGTIAILTITVAVLGAMLLGQRDRIVSLESQLHARAVEAPAHGLDPQPTAPAAIASTRPRTSWAYEPGVVHLKGAVDRPGVYEMPISSGITAGRLIAAAGRPPGAVRVTVRPVRDSMTRIDEWIAAGHEATSWDGSECMVFVHDPSKDEAPGGPFLRPDDTVWVARH